MRGFENELSKELDVAIATTEVELDSRTATVRTGEAAIGNLFADAIRARPTPTSRSPMAAACAARKSIRPAARSRAAT